MTGSNKPPAYGTREQVERDNQVWDRTYTPQSEQARGTEAETQPDFADVDTAKTAAMKDADPAAHSQGLHEDATLSALRIFAAGGLIAALGRDNLQPQTRTEATHDPIDTGIYGHASNSDTEKQMEIANESMKLDSQGVPLSDGKIATIYSQVRADQLAEEKKRKEEDDRFVAYMVAEATADAIEDMYDFWDDDDDWYTPSLTQAEWDQGILDLNAENDIYNGLADAARIEINEYLTAHPENVRALEEAEHSQEDSYNRHFGPGAPHTDNIAGEAAAARASGAQALGIDPATGARVANAGATDAAKTSMSANETQIQTLRTVNDQLQKRVQQMVDDATAFHARVPNMSGDQARTELLRAVSAREGFYKGLSGDQAKSILGSMLNEQMAEAQKSGDAEQIQKIQGRIDNLNGLTGEQARQLLIDKNTQDRKTITGMSDDQAKQALTAQAQEIMQQAQQNQTNAIGTARDIQHVSEISTQLEAKRREVEEFRAAANSDGNLSAEETARLEQLTSEMDVLTTESTQANEKMALAMRGAEQKLLSQSGQFALITDRRALQANAAAAAALGTAAAETEVATEANIQATQSAQDNVVAANEALHGPATSPSVITTAGAADLDSADPARLAAGRASGRPAPNLTEQDFRERMPALRQEMRQLGVQNIDAEKLRELAEKHRVPLDTAQRAYNRAVEHQERLGGAGGGRPDYARWEARSADTATSAPASIVIAGSAPTQQGIPTAQGNAVADRVLAASTPAQLPQEVLPSQNLDASSDYYGSFTGFNWTSTPSPQPDNVSLFGNAPYSSTVFPATPISSGVCAAPTDDSFGISGGSYQSFCESEGFSKYNDPKQEVASYNEPWYSTAWDKTTGFVSSIWAKLDAPTSTTKSTDPLAQSPTMLASATPNTTKLPGAGAGTASA